MPQKPQHTAPPLVAMHDEARGKGHHDSGTTIAFHEEMRFPVMTSLGNLNVTPDVVDTFLRAAADLTWRRRLIPFQVATGVPAPSPYARYVGQAHGA